VPAPLPASPLLCLSPDSPLRVPASPLPIAGSAAQSSPVHTVPPRRRWLSRPASGATLAPAFPCSRLLPLLPAKTRRRQPCQCRLSHRPPVITTTTISPPHPLLALIWLSGKVKA